MVNVFSVSPNFRPAYDMSFNLNIQKSLGNNAVLQVGYVGTQGRRLLVLRDINQAALGSGFIPGTNAAGFTFQQASRPYFSQFPNFGVIDEIQSEGTSNYNGLQVSLRTTVWHGLVAQFNYTWAHSLDEVTQYVGALPQDSTNFKNDYGNSDYDIRHNFNGYVVYDIPGSSHGPKWLSQGWQVTTKVAFPHRLAVQRPRHLRYQRHGRKYRSWCSGGRSVCRRGPHADTRQSGAVDQPECLRESGERRLRQRGPQYGPGTGLWRCRSVFPQEHTHQERGCRHSFASSCSIFSIV